MDENKTDFRGNKKTFIKIPVIISYGKEVAEIIADLIDCNNSEEKLASIKIALELPLKDEQKLFIIQKVLALPKMNRKNIAKGIRRRLENEDNN